tara:strand:+ start:515 stop:826 length:312 start_codon:yes stop_codon:yes gene_type:complete
MKKLLSQSPGKQTYAQWEGDDMSVVTEQNVTPILEQNKKFANEWKPGDYMTGSKHTHKVAEFPAVLYYDLVKKLGEPQKNPLGWKRWLNDPENKYFRTTGGKL